MIFAIHDGMICEITHTDLLTAGILQRSYRHSCIRVLSRGQGMKRGDQRGHPCPVTGAVHKMTGETNPAILDLGKCRTVGMFADSGALRICHLTGTVTLDTGHFRIRSVAGPHNMAICAVAGCGLHCSMMAILEFTNAVRKNCLRMMTAFASDIRTRLTGGNCIDNGAALAVMTDRAGNTSPGYMLLNHIIKMAAQTGWFINMGKIMDIGMPFYLADMTGLAGHRRAMLALASGDGLRYGIGIKLCARITMARRTIILVQKIDLCRIRHFMTAGTDLNFLPLIMDSGAIMIDSMAILTIHRSSRSPCGNYRLDIVLI